MNLLAAVEGLLFLCGDDGILEEDIAKAIGIEVTEVKDVINELQKNYEECSRGLKLEKYGDMCKLVTKSIYNEIFQKMVQIDEGKPLTVTALEVLAIVAYNEPVTRAFVDEVRGVSSGHMIRNLKLRDLITEVGRSDLPGRPYLYKTTNKFLDVFGISSLSDLPNLSRVEEEVGESDLFKVKYTEK